MSRKSAFLAKFPDAEIRGAQLIAIRHAIGPVAEAYFTKSGLSDIRPDEWYSMTTYLNVIYDIVEHEEAVMANLVSIGMKTVEHAHLPPEVDTLEKGLHAMQMGWKMNTRNADTVIWSAQKVDENTFICSNSSPFPADQEYGILYGFARKFVGNQRFSVAYENLNARDRENHEELRFLVKVS